MRILITSAYSPEGETGSAQVAKRLSEKLSEKHQVLYLCLGEKLGTERISKNLSYLYIPSVNLNDIWIPTINKKIVEEITEYLDRFSPEVVHAHNIIYGGLISLIWAKERAVPYVLTFHSIPSEGMAYIFPKMHQAKIISTLNYHLTANYIKNFTKHIDLIIALNQPVVDSLIKMEITTPYKIIKNGLDLNKFYKLKVLPPKDKIYFVYPGSYVDRKNQEYLVKVFANLPKNYILNLYGNKKSGSVYVEKLQKLIKSKNIQNVFINDFLDQEKLLKVYEKSHYLVSASLKEVQSMVYIESLAAGNPVIALENETVKEVVNIKNGLSLHQNTSPEKFAQELMRFVAKTSKKYKLVSDICQTSISGFDIENVILNTEKAYKYTVALKKVKPEIKEKYFYKTIKDIIPKQIDEMIPKDFKFIKKDNEIMPLKRTLFYTSIIGFLAMFASLFYNTKINDK